MEVGVDEWHLSLPSQVSASLRHLSWLLGHQQCFTVHSWFVRGTFGGQKSGDVHARCTLRKRKGLGS
jgi:hypothetical protein